MKIKESLNQSLFFLLHTIKFCMPNVVEFPNFKLNHLKSFEKLELLIAFGLRTAILLDKNLEVLCRYLDANKMENFLCAEFFRCKSGVPGKHSNLLLLAGDSGVIKLIDIVECRLVSVLKGHTGAICALKVIDGHVVSGGADSSIRLWNLQTLACVAVYGGLHGHKDRVLSVDAMNSPDLIVSAGTDCLINQWKIKRDASDQSRLVYFNETPSHSFSNVHRCPVTKIAYVGNLILSLSNNVISIIHNKTGTGGIERTFNLETNDPVYVGTVDFFGNCKSFDVYGCILIGISSNADVYIFDLRNILKEHTPYLVSTKIEVAEDVVCIGGTLYITSGTAVHKLELDFSQFNELY